MDHHRPPSDPATDESPKERVDREFGELVQGFRVGTTGVQVLFAFLLTVPFSAGFTRLPDREHWMLDLALGAAAVASGCFIAPAAQHRILFRAGANAKGLLMRRSNAYGIAGAVALLVAITSAALLVFRLLLVDWVAALLVALLAAFIIWAWFIQPLLTRLRTGEPLPQPPPRTDSAIQVAAPVDDSSGGG
ncbi:DUF6328 family protein [Sphaerisporangium viridialbum]|uniref:DUF6328 family protein n=1 Tax=Sphaerisporangium viridialbum TaxID=46189 RepID=UPI003C74FF90